MTEHQGRRSTRLPGWDYTSPGTYFLTICAYRRYLLFEESAAAAVIVRAWRDIPTHFSNAAIDAYVVMPNHVHGIVIMNRSPESVGARHASPLRTPLAGAKPRSLGAIVGSFKAAVTRELRALGLWSDEPLWQRNYYERIIRDDAQLDRVREYIINNPAAWQFDKENPARTISQAHEDDWGWLESAE